MLSLRRAHGQRSDCSSGVLGMQVEAMNFAGTGHAECVAALGLSPHASRIWREESGDGMDWRSLLHPSARGSIKRRG